MIALGKPVLQAAIDVEDLELAKRITEMAIKAGVDTIEAGTPLLYAEGIRSVKALKEIAGDMPVIADFKAQDGCYIYFASAARNGADYAVVSVVCNDAGTKEAIRAAKDTGIKVIGDMFAVPMDILPQRAKEVEALGADALFVHFGMDEAYYDKKRKQYDGVAEVVEVANVPVGVACDHKEDAVQAVKNGASFIAFGAPILLSPDNYDLCREYVDAVHSAR